MPMRKVHVYILLTLITFFIEGTSKVFAQQCIPPLKQVVLFDQAGGYYVYWKPSQSGFDYIIKVHCINNPPCNFTITVNSSNVLLMNGGWLGVHIPALPSTASTVTLSIRPPGCNTVFTAAFILTLDIITDNLDIATGECDGDTCKLLFNTWTTLQKLTSYANSKCGGGGAAVPASTVTCIDAPIDISLRKNAAGRWQIKPLDDIQCDTCYTFNFQITCGGSTYFVQDQICFNYAGPAIGCKQMMEENIVEQPITLYPNPANSKCNLRFAMEEPGLVSIGFYNALGLNVPGGIVNRWFDEGINEVELSLDDFTAGIYFVEVRGPNENRRLKLLKF